jgi:hypothetical protein
VTAAEIGYTYKDMIYPRPYYSKAIYAQPLTLQGSKPSSSDNNSNLSDSDPDLSSDDDGYSSEAEKQYGLSMRMNIPWDPIDE